MIKKATLLFAVIAFIITVSGCETAKGIGTGLKKADNWMQENFW